MQPISVCLLDGGVIGPGRELSTDKDTRWKVNLSHEGLVLEFVTERGCRHNCAFNCGVEIPQ
jgi:hypothetical protein